MKSSSKHLENILVQTNFGFIICHVVDNVNIDVILTAALNIVFTLKQLTQSTFISTGCFTCHRLKLKENI
jgi:hypothetical protein